MTEDEVIEFVSGLPGVAALTAGESNGAPEVAWGDTFFYYDPEGDRPASRQPFATIVTKDYEGFDTASNLNRPGIFRVNIGVGRHIYEDLFGHLPAGHAEHFARYDYAAVDQVIPHPAYATAGWISVLNPGEATTDQVRSLLTQVHARAAEQHRRH
jgi:hypothetical protein